MIYVNMSRNGSYRKIFYFDEGFSDIGLRFFLIAADGQKDSSLVDRPYEGGAL